MIEKNKTYVVTGGYGFLGSHLIDDIILKGGRVATIGRNWVELGKLQAKYGNSFSYLVGDIKDIELVRSLITNKVTGVFHLAAYKYVGEAENNVLECINSNVIGTMNILEVSAESKVQFVIGITGAAAVQVSGTYGATKMLNEKLFFEYQRLHRDIRFRVLRYGNILYSTGSVLCKWKKSILNNETITITDGDATRFFLTITEAVQLIYDSLNSPIDFAPYIPKLKSITINGLLMAMINKYRSNGKDIKVNIIGIENGNNKHEKIEENGLSSAESEHFTYEEIFKLI